MTPFRKRDLLLVLGSVVLAALLVVLLRVLPHVREHLQHSFLLVISLLLMLTFVMQMFWVSRGALGGLLSFLVIMIFIYGPLTALDPYYYGILILAFFLNSFLGSHIHRKLIKCEQDHKVSREKIQEDINLINDHHASRVAEMSAMEEKITSLLKLKSISEDLNSTLSGDEIIETAAKSIFNKFKGDIRVLFYTVNPSRKTLSLARIVKADNCKNTRLKTGGIFERWVVKNMQSLLVKDVNKDYRFSLSGKEKDEDFLSLIEKPLVNEGDVAGIIRVDSPLVDHFSQHDLRILDIIGELTAVALENSKLFSRTEELAIKDSLTGLFVHRYFMERFDEEINRGLRSGISFALIMLDIDDFKKFNDMYGHQAGDIILKSMSSIVQGMVAPGDIVARYGGEEFAVIKLNCGKEDAFEFAEGLRVKIARNSVNIRREKKSVTVSIGIATFPEDSKLREDLIWEADRNLYKAKTAGKNRVCSK
ncbi:MAG: sensor domain-containing diguanylate cyclase [Candidatus Omnitrophica bacterium]|nr:sensor domain-containing diguanylate cyclase [Candidatus Omnitrophota bacterium]